MSPERWQEIKQILDTATRFAAGERQSYLRRACAGDDALREEVESLLAFDDQTVVPEAALDRPVFDVNAEDPAVGRRIDHYRIVGPLGRGGMGAVYLASREDDYSQQVALKLIQGGLGGHDLVARFHEERQILADLDHPHIARLFDGGTTDDGLPYLVMELVEGEPVDEYCDRRRLGIRHRLELFRQVLAAVHFSHQHLVVHRDLKPGNILVTAAGVPKLIDFGIAKLLRPEARTQGWSRVARSPLQRRGWAKSQAVGLGFGAAPPAARQHQRLFSPRYASPEQVRGERVTTASDVYALGVLLYQLLAGSHPYPFEAVTEEELVQAICEAQPAAPSVTVARAGAARDPAEVAAARATRPAKLRRRLADGLDAIVMKAMRKRPEERYGSVERLSEDIGRWLDGLPVSARASSPAYRARKFVRRHRLPLAAAALALVVAAFILVTFIRLAQERARVGAIVGFVEDLFREQNPDRADGEVLTARDILERASVRVGPGLVDHPLVQAEVNAVLGSVYQNLGDLAEAQRLAAEALRLQRRHDPGNDSAVARRANELAAVLHKLGDVEAAEPLYGEALKRVGGCRSPDPDALYIASNLAVLYSERGDLAEAEDLARCVREERERRLPSDHPDIATSLGVEAHLHYRQGELEQAAELFRRALAIRREYYDTDHTKVANTLNNLGGVLLAGGQTGEAEEALRQALDIRRRLLGGDHPQVANTEKNLARALTALGEAAAAEPLARNAVAVLRSGKPGWRLADAESVLGGCLVALGRLAEAEPLLRGSLPIIEREKGEQSAYARAARQRIAALESSRAAHAAQEP